MPENETGTGSSYFLVTPEKLLEKAAKLQASVRKMTQACNRLRVENEGTAACFRGQAAEQFRSCLLRKVEKEEVFIGELAKLSERLQEIAAIYQKAEGENRNVSGRN